MPQQLRPHQDLQQQLRPRRAKMKRTSVEYRRRRRLMALALLAEEESTRSGQRPRFRIGWGVDDEQLRREGEFKRMSRMSVNSLNRLCGMLVELDQPAHTWVNRGPVSVTNKLQMTIRFLAGGMIDDIRVNGSVIRS
ncbi:hypothetical protein PF005_g5503 [Phytophthora fragariae]|uniref:Uncharacterized protein n=1 Tax=Phytophthora fragariae TaxID=53985 RepID=A0A6A3YUW1_9STRA|nr:hypothetical protein PF003_g9622 [Phytophthora fragariae]KAE8944296.1 hypothetical protein PF009_g6032 [Phytophthora fragariae]KAE9022785.1 hypothetical protein PF011_g4296 [Phytophthora fragariae]KAE9129695.1 hypothetical protein PF007_g4794 [Phytophthora fragariae]KAE9151453.1 hypothetical protein PF006_g4245 [Phytophthora fragariae]